MRVAITINTSWNIYNFRSGLIRALIKTGYEVVAIAPQDNYSKLLVEMGCEFRSITMSNTGSNPLKDFFLYKQLKKIYNEEKPDIIYQYTIKPNIYGSIAARQLGIPVINNVSGLGTVFLNSGIASKVAKILYSYSFKKVDLVFFQNGDDRRDFLSQIQLKNLKTDLLPGSGVDLSAYNSSMCLPSTFTFLMIARVILDKGIIEYLEAAKIVQEKFPNTRFQLLGQLDENHARGIKKEIIDNYVDQGIIEYLGVTDQVHDMIDHATCVVLPSYREGTPKTLLEGAAMSKPLITTDAPGCREVVIDQENGFLCKLQDAQDLAEKMLEMRSLSEEKLKKMGSNSRVLAGHKFDEKIIIKKYIEHSNNLMT